MESESQTQAVAMLTTTPTFELRRFGWGTPDRLEVSGMFDGLRDTPAGAAPVLVVREGESVHRLPAVPDSFDGPPEDGQVWQAQFAWQDPPVAFSAAELELGADLVVDLPEPATKRRRARPRTLEVRTAHVGGADPRPETSEVVGDAQSPQHAIANGRAASVGSQVELLAAEEEAREVRASLQQTQAELTRAREDLQAERERRAGDGERFREGLAKVRESAEHALTEEQVTVSLLRADLREAQAAIEAQNAAAETLHAQIETADATRTRAEAAAQAEIEALREQVAQLESDDTETERLRSQLEQAHGAVDQARSDAERLLDRLTSIRAE
jgi:hypothetical protein